MSEYVYVAAHTQGFDSAHDLIVYVAPAEQRDALLAHADKAVTVNGTVREITHRQALGYARTVPGAFAFDFEVDGIDWVMDDQLGYEVPEPAKVSAILERAAAHMQKVLTSES